MKRKRKKRELSRWESDRRIMEVTVKERRRRGGHDKNEADSDMNVLGAMTLEAKQICLLPNCVMGAPRWGGAASGVMILSERDGGTIDELKAVLKLMRARNSRVC